MSPKPSTDCSAVSSSSSAGAAPTAATASSMHCPNDWRIAECLLNLIGGCMGCIEAPLAAAERRAGRPSIDPVLLGQQRMCLKGRQVGLVGVCGVCVTEQCETQAGRTVWVWQPEVLWLR